MGAEGWRERGTRRRSLASRVYVLLVTGLLADMLRLQLLKLEWFRETREMREAKRTDTDGVISAEDVELEEDSGRRNHHPDQDEAMLGMIEEQEQAEVDALLSSYSPSDYSSQIRPDSPHFSDEDDYDSLFRDFLVQQKSQGSPFSEDVEMSL